MKGDNAETSGYVLVYTYVRKLAAAEMGSWTKPIRWNVIKLMKYHCHIPHRTYEGTLALARYHCLLWVKLFDKGLDPAISILLHVLSQCRRNSEIRPIIVNGGKSHTKRVGEYSWVAKSSEGELPPAYFGTNVITTTEPLTRAIYGLWQTFNGLFYLLRLHGTLSSIYGG